MPGHIAAVVEGTCLCVHSSKQSLKTIEIIQYFFCWLWYTDIVTVITATVSILVT